jgi:hypothetical protein
MRSLATRGPVRRCAVSLVLAAATLSAVPAHAQGGPDEAGAARYMESVRGRAPLLYAFLREMPKGGDLHSHLSGAVYAESWLRWAAEDAACISVRRLSIVRAPCTPTPDTMRASDAIANAALYGDLIDAMSMRNWNAARENGHDQFFDTFGRLDAPTFRVGDQLAEAVHRAASGNVSYLELMLTADGRVGSDLGRLVGWKDDFGEMRRALLNAGLARAVAVARARVDSVEARRDTLLGCGGDRPDRGCGVTVRWLYQVARANPPAQVYAQILTGFELAKADPRVVGFNLVQPEDAPLAMSEYRRQMRIIAYLRGLYPGVRVTLHAGELAPGLVPPEGLRFHVREAVETAGASRIGHGVDVLYEDRPHELLRTMAERGVMVEIALTSNDAILGVRGPDHPLHAYLRAGVPVALATDDEGVARSEMTREYQKAVMEQELDYATLKRMARTSLEHAFIGGESLWSDARAFRPVLACAPENGGLDGRRCRQLADRSPRARLQIDQERAFLAFEHKYAALTP